MCSRTRASSFWFALVCLFLFASCRQEVARTAFVHEVLLPMTPVKHQGRSQLCWAYAMLSTIETEHITRGDSVHLSVAYVRHVVANPSQRGMGHTLLHAIERYGIVPFDSYPDSLSDKRPLPRWVFMLGARYTPREFAHSVCAPGEYVALTSSPRHPYYQHVVLPLPDNWERNSFLNVPPDTLLRLVERAVRNRHGVCWEGDTHECGFSVRLGIADAHDSSLPTDNHCMAIVGLARHPADGRLFFIMKNSWGDVGPYGGLMYMSSDYLRHKTVAVYMTRDAMLGRLNN